MSGTGRCYDNARMESFFATLKKEKLYPIDARTLTREEVQSVIFRYISYYNLRRIKTDAQLLCKLQHCDKAFPEYLAFHHHGW